MSGLERFKSDVIVSFESPRHAKLVHATLDVDPELRPHEVERTMALQGNTLTIAFQANDVRMLRAATGTFMDLLGVATLTMESFRDSIKE